MSTDTLQRIPAQTPNRGLIVPGVAFLMALLILLGLGVWQVQRLAWKTALIAEITERSTAPAQPLPPQHAWAALRAEDYAYRRVTLTGTLENDKESRVFRPLSESAAHGRYSGVGDLILTPLRLADGAVVLVNRGFVPQDRSDPATRRSGQIEGPVMITGLMREPETRNFFTPADDPKSGAWFTRDPVAMAAFWHLDRSAPFTVDADSAAVPGGLPQGGETVLDIPNNHLSYALTWFGLTIGLCLVFAGFVWKRITGNVAVTETAPDATKRW